MRRLALTLTLASLTTLFVGGARARRVHQCPVVDVSCPDTGAPGTPVTFTANVSGRPADVNPTYNWVVSAGTVTSGQGTSSITVDTTGMPPNSVLTATVDLKGLPESCPASTSCSTAVPGHVGYHDKIDEYGNIRFEDEKARLDNYAIELRNWDEGVGYIIAYGGRVSRRGEALRRAERAKRYITEVRGVPVSRVVAMDGGYRDSLTVELRLRSKGVPPPEPVPTVDPNEVRFINARPKARARRR